MRMPFFLLLLAAIAAAGSGCTTTAEKFAAIGEGDGGDGDGGDGGGGGDGDGGDGGGDGGDNTTDPDPTELASGDAAFAFNSNDADPSNDQLVELTVDNAQATVIVDPKDPDMKWPEPITMERYVNPNHAANSLGGSYREYRKIVRNETDAELQLWNFDHSYAAQYRVWEGGNTNASNNLVVFYGGNKTPAAAMPTTGTATYDGAFGGTATAANWVAFERSVPDPYAPDPDATVGVEVNPNAELRVTGTAAIEADFGAGSVDGRINPTRWRIFEPGEHADSDGYINITNDESLRPYPHQYQLHGTIEGADYSGRVMADNDAYVPGANGFTGSFFGADADETTGIMHHQGTWPHPNDGESPNERNGRGYVDIRGVFHGEKQ